MIPGVVRTDAFEEGGTVVLVPGAIETTWIATTPPPSTMVTAIGTVPSDPQNLWDLFHETRPVVVAIHDLDSSCGRRNYVVGLASMAALSAGAVVIDRQFVHLMSRAELLDLQRLKHPAGVEPRDRFERLAVGVALFLADLAERLGEAEDSLHCASSDHAGASAPRP